MRGRLLLQFMLLTAMQSTAGELNESIRHFMENKPAKSGYEIDNEYLFSKNALPMFYMNRMYAPAWINRDLPAWIDPDTPARINRNTPSWISRQVSSWIERLILDKNGYELLDYVRQVETQGLQPLDFHLTLIEKYFGRIVANRSVSEEDAMKLDILLTDAFMLLGSQLYYGRVDPARDGGDWKMQLKEPELRLDLKLEEALFTNNLANSLEKLAPRYPSYWMMKKELAFFLGLKSQPWPDIHSVTAISPGESDPSLPEIRKRLMKLRYHLSDTVSLMYDKELGKQLNLFQNDWGLNSDSLIGKRTLEILNIKPEKLINQLKVNMERFRWLPLQLTRKYIVVNIANYALDLIEGTDTLISMRVIVGKDYRKTPVFNERMTYLVFSPSWTIPPTILRNEVIPELLKGPGYLKRKQMKILNPDGSEIAYNHIDWSKISKKRFPYMVRQDPGPLNSLGRVKFMFPNSYNVYIHDTPARASFDGNDRALSSGCIRAEKPYDLAVVLLSDMPEWSPAGILKAMGQTREQKVVLKTPVDVVLLYLTAWSDGNSRIQFRKDIYNRDEHVLKALHKKPETPAVIQL